MPYIIIDNIRLVIKNFLSNYLQVFCNIIFFIYYIKNLIFIKLNYSSIYLIKNIF